MNLDRIFSSTCNYARQSGASSHGDPTYGSATSFKARVQPRNTLTPDELKYDHVLYTATAVQQDDKVWLPGENTGTAPGRVVLAVESSPSLSGDFTLYKVML